MTNKVNEVYLKNFEYLIFISKNKFQLQHKKDYNFMKNEIVLGMKSLRFCKIISSPKSIKVFKLSIQLSCNLERRHFNFEKKLLVEWPPNYND